MSKLSHNKTMIPWRNILKKVIDDFKDKGYTFNHIAERHIITIAQKMDMSYDFYIKHNMQAVEWKIRQLLTKRKIYSINFHVIGDILLTENFKVIVVPYSK